MVQKLSGIELLEALCLACAPSGCEREARDLIISQTEDFCGDIKTDKLGNVIVKVLGESHDKRMLVCAHMDEVGFMITDIDDDGSIKFTSVGGIDPRVMCGRRVVLMSFDGSRRICGVISSKPIHLQNTDERKTVTPIDKMYIDIGADSADEAVAHIKIGDYGTFISDFRSMGDGMLKGKAIDDRFGCAVMIELIRSFHKAAEKPQYDTYFAFTVREEVGISGANTAAYAVNPDYALILESTAIADIVDVDEHSRVAECGGGGVISLLDRTAIYDRDFVNFALDTAKSNGIKAQIKQYVSGGNDAGAVQRTRAGVRCLALSAPTRYLHTACTVCAESDYFAVRELAIKIICGINTNFSLKTSI